MLEHHFYLRLLLQVVFGLLFVVAFMRMGRNNPQEERKGASQTPKVIGAIFAVLGKNGADCYSKNGHAVTVLTRQS